MSDADREQRLGTENEALRAENAKQAEQIELLTRKVTELEQRLNQGSRNSSLAPSSDSPKQQAEATKTRSERRAAEKAKRKDEVERRRGKQAGAPGKNLSMSAVPDVIIDHLPTNCESCGENLAVGRTPRVRASPGPRHPRADHHHDRAPLGAQDVSLRHGERRDVPEGGHRTGLLRAEH